MNINQICQISAPVTNLMEKIAQQPKGQVMNFARDYARCLTFTCTMKWISRLP